MEVQLHIEEMLMKGSKNILLLDCNSRSCFEFIIANYIAWGKRSPRYQYGVILLPAADAEPHFALGSCLTGVNTPSCAGRFDPVNWPGSIIRDPIISMELANELRNCWSYSNRP